VIYEDDTPLFEQLKAGEFSVNEELACEMYEELISTAAAAGFHQYEIANFARNREISNLQLPIANCQNTAGDHEKQIGNWKLEIGIPSLACQHNVNYWRGGAYHGLGPSATGYVRGVRTKNWSNTQLYCEQLEKGKRAIESSEELSPLRRAGEIAAFGLRMNAGWPFDEFQRVTGLNLQNEWGSEMEQLTARGWAVHSGDGFRLTHQGLRFADAAAEMFLR